MKFLKMVGTMLFLFSFLTSCNMHNFNIKTPREIRSILEPNVLWIGSLSGSHGSGFISNYKGFRGIVTNSHVCEIAKNGVQLYVKTNLNEQTHRVEILHRDRSNDLCITTVPKKLRSKGLTLGMQPHEGDSIYILGFPYGNRKTFVSGEWTGEKTITILYSYSKKECPGRFKNVISYFGKFTTCYIDILSGEITASIYPGNSGSAVVNNRGLVVGVVFAGSSNSTVSNYLVPVRKLRNAFKLVTGR